MNPSLGDMAERAAEGCAIGRDEALEVLRLGRDDPWAILAAAGRVRRAAVGNRVHLCSIAPVKVGRCGQDCRWCAQSGHWSTDVEPAGIPPAESLVDAARAATDRGATHFGLVTSGGRLSEDELRRVIEAARAIREATGLGVCGSFGALTVDEARRLAEAGFVRYNHNVETSARHFPSVCSTHTYSDRLASAEAARAGGMELCCGMLIGIGETDADRVDAALAIRDLGAAVVPINILHPIAGTPLADAEPVSPMEALTVVAMVRLVMPTATIKVAGGREHALRDLQSLMFEAGADAMLIGNYLTTAGRDPARDLEMLADLGLEPAPAEQGVGDGSAA